MTRRAWVRWRLGRRTARGDEVPRSLAARSDDAPDDSKQRGDRRVQNVTRDSERTRLSQGDDEGADEV